MRQDFSNRLRFGDEADQPDPAATVGTVSENFSPTRANSFALAIRDVS